LFLRTGKRMYLSTSGKHLLGYAQRLLALAEEARHVVTEGRYGGSLRIGGMERTIASRLPLLLSTYHARHPVTRLELSTGTSGQLLDQVRTGALDCAFLALPPSIQGTAALNKMGLTAKTVWREELLLLLPESESPVRGVPDVRPSRLAAFAPGCAYRALAEKWLGITASTDWKVEEMGSYPPMVACVAAGAYVAVLPQSVLDVLGAPPELKTVRIGRANTYLLWWRGYDVSAFRNLSQLLKEVRPTSAFASVTRSRVNAVSRTPVRGKGNDGAL
jgi:DNA-binding transcriptional LysR family regulator